MKLYEISKELATINDTIINADGEISSELEQRLDQLNLALEQKASGIRKWLASIDGDNLALDAEIKRLQKIKKVRENLYDRLKEYVKKNMELADLKKIETAIGTFSICKSPASVSIIAEEMIPQDFKKEIPAHWEPDSAKIKEALEEGYEVPGVKYNNDRTHIRIK